MVFARALPILAATLLVACGGNGDDATSTPATAAPASSAPATALPASPEQESTDDAMAATAPAALQFSAPLVGGGEIELGELAGRPVLLWFWAPW